MAEDGVGVGSRGCDFSSWVGEAAGVDLEGEAGAGTAAAGLVWWFGDGLRFLHQQSGGVLAALTLN